MAHRDRRGALLGIGALAGLVAASWLLPAGLTQAAGTVGGAQLGGWLAALVPAACAGVAPSFLLPRPAAPHQRSE